MRLSLRFLLALLPGVASCQALPQEEVLLPSRFERKAAPPDAHKELKATVGVREFDDGAWDPLESQVDFGLDFAERIERTFLWLEGGLATSYDRTTVTVMGERVGIDAQTFEASAGLMVPFDFEALRLRFYVGAGASLFFADVESRTETSSDYDTTLGGYAKAGVLLRISDATFIGVQVRRFEGAELQFEDFDADPDSDQLSVVFTTFL